MSGSREADGIVSRGRSRLVDVARLAGVSTSTASRVLNNADYRIAAATRARILEASNELGFTPNAAAQALSRTTSGAIALLVPSPVSIGYTEMFQGVLDYSAQRRLPAIVMVDTDPAEAEQALDRLVGSARVDGAIIVSSVVGDGRFESLRKRDFPHVYMMRAVTGSRRNVTIDDAAVSAAAVDYLFALGHRSVVHVGGFPWIEPAVRRARGFSRRCAQLGVASVVVEAELSESGGFGVFDQLRAVRPAPTAVYTAMVGQALGVIRAAHLSGIRVPDELSVMSFDDVPMCEYVTPTITSVDIPSLRLAHKAVDSLLAQIEGKPPRSVVVPTDPVVVARESTSPPPA